MLQHELKIYRHWKCAVCGRTVRTRGAVASRMCECAEPATFMQLIDTPQVGKFDASAFTTYDNEADSTPTERELVEDLPAHLMPPKRDTENVKPTFRRGTGYLRAETAPEVQPAATATEPVAQDSFGAGIDSGQATPVATDTPDGKPPGKKRRRRRRRKPREAGDVVADTSATSADTPMAESAAAPAVVQPVTQQQSAPAAEASGSAEPTAETGDSAADASAQTDGSDVSSESESVDGAPKKKRRRRRRKGK